MDLALKTALALNSDIQHRSAFDRKHYFYSDLPTGYQITQHYCEIDPPRWHLIHSEFSNTSTNCDRWISPTIWKRRGRSGKTNTVRTSTSLSGYVSRNHNLLWHRKDTAKSTFDSRRHLSQTDLNRAGAGLLEIVSEPDIRSVSRRYIFSNLIALLIHVNSIVHQKRPVTTFEHCKRSYDPWALVMAIWNK